MIGIIIIGWYRRRETVWCIVARFQTDIIFSRIVRTWSYPQIGWLTLMYVMWIMNVIQPTKREESQYKSKRKIKRFKRNTKLKSNVPLVHVVWDDHHIVWIFYWQTHWRVVVIVRMVVVVMLERPR